MPVCSIYSSVYKPFIKEHNDLTPLFLFSEQTLLSVTTLVCSLKNTQLHCHTWGWKKSLLTIPWCFLLPHIHREFTSYTSNTRRHHPGSCCQIHQDQQTKHKQFGWGVLFLCEQLKPRTLSPFRWVSLKGKNKWSDFIGSYKHISALEIQVGFWGFFFFFSIWPCTTIPSFTSPGSKFW